MIALEPSLLAMTTVVQGQVVSRTFTLPFFVGLEWWLGLFHEKGRLSTQVSRYFLPRMVLRNTGWSQMVDELNVGTSRHL